MKSDSISQEDKNINDFYAYKFNSLEQMDKFLEKHILPKLHRKK